MKVEGIERVRTGAWWCLAALWAISGCAHNPNPTPNEEFSVRTIEISDVVSPETLYAYPGEEVRWQNLRENPIRVGFLTMRLLDKVGCEKGMTTLFGQVRDLVTIQPGEWVSVCFVRSGDVKYNVWFDADNPKGTISPTAIVRVERVG